jgi:hypothetical protein
MLEDWIARIDENETSIIAIAIITSRRVNPPSAADARRRRSAWRFFT